MDIRRYTGYFHDGTLISISHTKNEIIFELESAVILDEWNVDSHLLSPNKTIKWYLIISDVSQVSLNDEKYKHPLEMKYENGEILDIEINKDQLSLLVEWTNFKTTPKQKDVSSIEIKANKIYWILNNK